MPNLPTLTIPADAFAKADEKVTANKTDYYTDLTDEEREAEGLPPREAPKPDPEPAKEPEPEKEDEPEPDDDGSVEATKKLFEDLAGLREDLKTALKPKDEPVKAERDELLEAALEHEDPVVRGLAERLKDTEDRLAARENGALQDKIERQLAQDDAEFDAVQSHYLIGGKPMTDDQVKKVEKFIIENPDVGRRLTIEQTTRVVFPDAARSAKPAPAKPGPAGSTNGVAAPVATIVDSGSTAGAGKSQDGPRAYPDMQTAVREAGKRFGWTR